MATIAAPSPKKRRVARRAATRRHAPASSRDAISLLKADHRQVAGWFAQFGKARAVTRKNDLAGRICRSLRVHMTIEEELFYPAFLAATQARELHHEAEVEHEGARRLIAAIEQADARDEYFAARVTVLAEMISHHVKEEEEPGGMFAQAARSGMDLRALGVAMKARANSLVKAGDPVTRRPRGEPRLVPAFADQRRALHRY